MDHFTKRMAVGVLAVALVAALLVGAFVANTAQAHGGPGGRGGDPAGDAAIVNAAATALGMTTADLTTALRAGQTLSQIAQSKNVDPNVVEKAIVDAKKAEIDQLSADLTLDQLFGELSGGFRGGPPPNGTPPSGTPYPMHPPRPTATP
ncbi:MAG: hypothetical protein U0641_10380 [Anaerolineae bacterium]